MTSPLTWCAGKSPARSSAARSIRSFSQYAAMPRTLWPALKMSDGWATAGRRPRRSSGDVRIGQPCIMRGDDGKLSEKVPNGLFPLELPGSQGSHPGHSGILQGNPATLDLADFARLANRAKGGFIERSDFGQFIAENFAEGSKAQSARTERCAAIGGRLRSARANDRWHTGNNTCRPRRWRLRLDERQKKSSPSCLGRTISSVHPASLVCSTLF